MLLGRLRFSFVVFAVLGGLVTSGQAQVAPAPPPAAGDVTPAPADPAARSAPPTAGSPSSTAPVPDTSVATPQPDHPMPPAATSAPVASGVPGPDPALARRAAKAKASGKVLEIFDVTVVTGCRDLGEESTRSSIEGLRGRASIRIELRKAAVERGASHIRFSDYRNRNSQSEAARLYDCTAPEPETAVVGSGRAAPRGSIGVQLELVPAGSLNTDITGASQDIDAETTFGISGSLDYFVSPSLAIEAGEA